VGEPTPYPELTPEERHIIALLRQGPRSVNELAEALQTSPEHIRGLLERLDGKVGIVPLFRSGTLSYGLAE
jgi:DNA-binding CsgD family transcriptional regulator